MALYEYNCDENGRFEKLRPMSMFKEPEKCPVCGSQCERIMSVVNHTFGWTLSDRSHERFGPRDEFVKNV